MTKANYDTEEGTFWCKSDVDLGDDLKRVINVLDELEFNVDGIAAAVLDYCVDIDPIHLCRMGKRGLFEHSDYLHGDLWRLINLEMLTPIYHDEQHIGEAGIHLVRNDVRLYRYSDTDTAMLDELSEETAENLNGVYNVTRMEIMETVRKVDMPGEKTVVKTVDQHISEQLIE